MGSPGSCHNDLTHVLLVTQQFNYSSWGLSTPFHDTLTKVSWDERNISFLVIVHPLVSLKHWPSHCIFSGHNLQYKSHRVFYLSPFPWFFFLSLLTHTHNPPVCLFFKRLQYCGSYWFLCFGCYALRDLKAKESVVFLSKLLQSVCQSASSAERTQT